MTSTPGGLWYSCFAAIMWESTDVSKTLIQTHTISAAVARHSWTDYSSVQLAAELVLPFFDSI